MRSSPRTALLYLAFAIAATAANIAAQELTVQIYRGVYSMLAGVALGTGVGLAVKYLLDKRYIFAFETRSAAHDGQTFVVYTLTGVATTALFWGFEFGFDALFDTRAMRYTGAVLGLSLGYAAKYQLDKRYVFVH